MINILVCGNYGATNLGDEAILSGIKEIFRNIGSDFVVRAMGPGSEAIKDLHKCESCDLFPAGIRSFIKSLLSGSIWKTVDFVRDADLVVVGGGGLFTDEKLMAVLIWSMQVNLFKLLKKPYICIGQSVGPLRTTFGRFIAKRVFRSSHLNIVRDDYSVRLLNVLGIDGVTALSDCAFALHPPESTEEVEDPYIVMAIRPWLDKDDKKYEDLAKLIKYIHSRYNLKTVLVPFQILKDDDSKILAKIFDLVGDDSIVELMDYQDDFRCTLELIAKAKVVIGMRLHSLIFSTLARRPFIALSYSTKVEEYVKQTDMQDYLIRWTDLNFPLVKGKFDHLMEAYDEVTDVVEQGAMKRRSKVQEYATLIGSMINVGK